MKQSVRSTQVEEKCYSCIHTDVPQISACLINDFTQTSEIIKYKMKLYLVKAQ